MCYEKRFFSEGAKKKTSTRAEPTAIAERQRRDVRPDRPQPVTKRPEDCEHELETA